MPRALLSVHNKTDLVSFAGELVALGWELIASGGTAQAIQAAGFPVTPVERITRHPEMLGGRVKTLHPAIHGAILARDTDSDFDELKEQGYAPISMVVCNLYPFQQTVAVPGVTLADAIEQIDIGGVTLLRAAAKNHVRVAVVCDTADYAPILGELRAHGQVSDGLRRHLAVKAFQHTRDYDTAIHAWLANELSADTHLEAPIAEMPETMSLALHRVGGALRYGENPHQKAALYTATQITEPFGAHVLGGKELSYNNILDIDAAWRAVSSFAPDGPTVVIVKHLTPCGIATAATLPEAFTAAYASDSASAFGCVMAVSEQVDEAFVRGLGDLFIEVIAAPAFTPVAQDMLHTKRKNCRLLEMPPIAAPAAGRFEMRSVANGVLVQTSDTGDPAEAHWRVVTKRQPTDTELAALRYGWKAVQHVRSNAIVLAIPGATIGIGGGVSSRLDAARLAVEKAGARASGAAMASDAFFPFADSFETGVKAGVTAVIQPGGALRDKEVIAAADAAGITMVFTGARHFRH